MVVFEKIRPFLEKYFQSKDIHSFKGSGGGYINQGYSCIVNGTKYFLKVNTNNALSLDFFKSEYESLKAIESTGAIRVPKPIYYFEVEGICKVLVTEFIDFRPLSKFQYDVGTRIAKMHSFGNPDHNKFGFHIPTYLGNYPQANALCDSWIDFFLEQKFQPQIDMLDDKSFQSDWSTLKLEIPKLFESIPSIKPSLCHGDLWSGNVGETSLEPVLIDPGCFWGHSEFDLSLSLMFGGFSHDFFTAYHTIIPKTAGFDKRQCLYTLYNFVNHWNHFGNSYKSASFSALKELQQVLR